MLKQRYFIVSCLILLAAFIVGCGIGPSNGDDTDSGEGDPAQVSLRVNPRVIDSGDRIKVAIDIYAIEDPEIAVKIRIPVALSYVVDSSTLTVDNVIYDAGPLDNESDSNYTYLVYYLDEDNFALSDQGLLELTLKGESNIANGKVAVDIDLDDPEISNSQEFDIANPQFDSQASEDVRVGPASSSSTSGGSSSSATSSSSSSSSATSSSSSS